METRATLRRYRGARPLHQGCLPQHSGDRCLGVLGDGAYQTLDDTNQLAEFVDSNIYTAEPPRPLLAPKFDDPVNQVTSILRAVENTLTDVMVTIRRNVRAEEREFQDGVQETSTHSAGELLAELPSVRDLAVAANSIKQIARDYHVRSLLQPRQALSVVAEERDLIGSLVDAIENLHLDDQESERDEEMVDEERVDEEMGGNVSEVGGVSRETSATLSETDERSVEPGHQNDAVEERADGGYAEYLMELQEEDQVDLGASEPGEVAENGVTDGGVTGAQADLDSDGEAPNEDEDEDVDDVVHWKSKRFQPTPSWASSKRSRFE